MHSSVGVHKSRVFPLLPRPVGVGFFVVVPFSPLASYCFFRSLNHIKENRLFQQQRKSDGPSQEGPCLAKMKIGFVTFSCRGPFDEENQVLVGLKNFESIKVLSF